MSGIHNDQNIILALLNTNLTLISIVENINTKMNMSNTIDSLLPQVHTKNILENCRSALDYMTYLIVKTYKVNVPDDKIKFPFKRTLESFENDKLVKILKKENFELFELLKTVQPFTDDKSFSWLKTFIEINNKYKHQGFIPLQRRFATENGGWVAMSHGMSLDQFTTDLTEETTNINTTTTTDFKNDRSIKFDFVFENGEELVTFLRQVTDGIYHLINKIWQNGPKKPIHN